MPGGAEKKSTLRSHTTADNDIDQLIESALSRQAETFEKLLHVQTEAFKQCLQCYMESTNTRMDSFIKEVTKDLCDIKSSLEFTQKDVAELKATQTTTESVTSNVEQDLAEVKKETDKLSELVDYLENQSRRNNLRIDGVPELPNESWEQTQDQVKKTFASKLQLSSEDIEIERAHRTGNKRHSTEHRNEEPKPRTIVVKLNKFKDREAILKQAKVIKCKGLYINEDFSQKVLEKRKDLLPQMMKARQDGKIAFLSFNRLIVKERN